MLRLLNLIASTLLLILYLAPILIIIVVLYFTNEAIKKEVNDIFGLFLAFAFIGVVAGIIGSIIKSIESSDKEKSFQQNKRSQDSKFNLKENLIIESNLDNYYKDLMKGMASLILKEANWLNKVESSKKKIGQYHEVYEKQLGHGKIWEVRHRVMLRGGSFNLCFGIYSKDFFHSIQMQSDGIAVLVYVSKKNILNYGYADFLIDLEANGFYRYALHSPNLFDKWFVKTFVNADGNSIFNIDKKSLESIFLYEQGKIAPILIKHFA